MLKIKNISYGLILSCNFLLVSVVDAKHNHHAEMGIERCLKEISKIKNGQFMRIEYRHFSHEGQPSYEIELKTEDNREWEFECTRRGQIIEIEQEVVSANHPLFKKRAKISEKNAQETALSIYPGVIEKVEYEIEFDGTPVYELNIESSDGTEFNVEVSAITGEIIEVSTESWEIGNED